MFVTMSCVSTHAEKRSVDLIITGGVVVPISAEPIEDGGVAIHGGAIVAVGTSEEIASGFTASETVNAEGMAVLPGLVNAHTHAPMTLFRGIADDRDLMDWLQNYIFPAEAKNVDAEFVKWGTRLAAAEMIQTGTTTFADMYYFEADIAREVRAAGMRGVLGETFIDFPAPDNKTWEDAIAYMRKFAEEFRDDPLVTPALAPHAPFTVSPEHLKEVRKLADELGVPILIHLSETEAEQAQIAERFEGKTPTRHLADLGFLGDDVLAAHGVWLSDADMTLLAENAVGVVHCAESNMMLASGVAPVTQMIEKGMEVGLGTDGPAGSNNDLDMIDEMATAARLQKISNRDPKALGAVDVLRLATLGSATALGMDDRIGTIEVGKRADLIIVDLQGVGTQPYYSVESAIVYSTSGDDVVTTIVDGKFLMRDRKILTIDVAKTLAKAREYRDSILASLESD